MLYTIVVKRALRCLLNRREEADSSLLCCSCARANGPAIPTLRAVLLLLLHHRAPSTYTRYIISYVHVKSMPERGIIVQRKQTRECHAPGITLSVNVMTVLIFILTLKLLLHFRAERHVSCVPVFTSRLFWYLARYVFLIDLVRCVSYFICVLRLV